MNEIIDISPIISRDTAVWPGDTPFRRDVALSITSGDNLELSSITTTVHIGAHVDAPNHYTADGPGIAHRALNYYLGRCQVVTVEVERGQRVFPSHLRQEIAAPRLLFRTNTFPDPNHFNTDFAALSSELIDYCHARGVRLIGLDTPSVDLCDDRELESHNAIARHDMAILEGIVLTDAVDGLYTLIALPLRIQDADASPVRAALIPMTASNIFQE